MPRIEQQGIDEKIINTITNGVGLACQTMASKGQNNLTNSCSMAKYCQWMFLLS
jgi:hypothetical protein